MALADQMGRFSWNETRSNRRRDNPGRAKREAFVGEPLADDFGAVDPMAMPRPLDGVEEDFLVARRTSWMTSAEGPSGPFLLVVSLLVVLAVAALVAMTLGG